MLFFPLLNAKLYKIFYWDKYFLIKVQKLTVVCFTLRGVKTGYNMWLCSAKRLEYCLAGLEKLYFQNSCVEFYEQSHYARADKQQTLRHIQELE